jgi:hypothetical protein
MYKYLKMLCTALIGQFDYIYEGIKSIVQGDITVNLIIALLIISKIRIYYN